MKVLFYNEIKPEKIPNLNKIKKHLEEDDFYSANVKKIASNLYSVRLNKSNRLLFSIYRYKNENYALLLEYLPNHAYEKSRFLRGEANIDETKIPVLTKLDEDENAELVYLNTQYPTFNLLDKIISFDDAQQQIYTISAPIIVIGSAGSGKTALTLEKMKQMTGEILYLTRSPYLIHNSRNLYYAQQYVNENQEISFLSFDDYLASVKVPNGKEVTFLSFNQWFSRHRVTKNLSDPYQIFEEFKGVITGNSEEAFLSRDAYLALGIKQSIFQQDERKQVYLLFEKYLNFMKTEGFYDSNILSFESLKLVEPRYDFIVVDEVQDLTNIQLQLVLNALREPNQFILCGDSNQIVHPNFFSWSKIKSLFYQQNSAKAPTELIRILNSNYRNSPEVTEVANKILKIKTSRFGSVDKESNYLVKSNAHNTGTVILLAAENNLLRDLNKKTSQSTRFAVIVMHPEQKSEAKQHFDTPLVFSIQEAKGLEYENIILYQFISGEEQRFHEITSGVTSSDLEGDALHFSRTRDKSDKSLEIYKFHINSLYVGITRAVKNIYMIENKTKQHLFDLLDLKESQTGLDLHAYKSDLEEWRHEAHKLEMQGKQEQAEEIRKQILKIKSVPWEVLDRDNIANLHHKAIVENNKKSKLLLFEYALIYHHQGYINELVSLDFKPAKNPQNGINMLNQKYYMMYDSEQTMGVIRKVDQYGVDFRNEFNQTPLMIASRLGNPVLVNQLIDAGANPKKINNAGLNAFQIALEQAVKDPKYPRKKLAAIFQCLEPDNLTIQTQERLYQLDNRLMEFLMLNLMLAMFYLRLGDKVLSGNAFTSGDFCDALKHFPSRIVSEQRKKRQYISSILSKNEVDRNDKYNRRLFLRVKRGHYTLNPNLSIRIEGEWIKIYELLQLNMVHFSKSSHSLHLSEHFEKNLKAFKMLD